MRNTREQSDPCLSLCLQAWFFESNAWFDKAQGDGKIERLLKASGADPRANRNTYKVVVHTGDMAGAGELECWRFHAEFWAVSCIAMHTCLLASLSQNVSTQQSPIVNCTAVRSCVFLYPESDSGVLIRIQMTNFERLSGDRNLESTSHAQQNSLEWHPLGR